MATIAGAILETSGHIKQDQVQVLGRRPAIYNDEAIVTLVIEDARRAENHLAENQVSEHWKEAAVLFQSPRTQRTFEGSTTTRANTARFKVAQAVQTLVPGMQSGIFYETPPFQFRPRSSSKESTTRAKMSLFAELLDRCGFEMTAKKAMESQVLYGTVICKGGWTTRTRIRKQYIQKGKPLSIKVPFEEKPRQVATIESDTMEVENVEEEINAPFFEVCALGSMLVDPGWTEANELHKAKYVIHRTYPTFKDLDALRENDLYDIPSQEELLNYFFAHDEQSANPVGETEEDLNLSGELEHAALPNERTSVDPLEVAMEMLERWDAEQCHVILRLVNGNALIIRKGDHTLSRIPFFAANFWNIPEAPWGIGAGRIVGSDQRIDKGLTDAALDILSFACNPQYARDIGANVNTQQIKQRLGGIIDVSVRPGGRVDDVFRIVETPKVPSEAFAVLQMSNQSANNAIGSDEAFTQGSLPGKGGSSAARTATGAGGIISANAGRIQGPVGHFCDGVLLPFLEMLEEMVKEFMPISELRGILGDKLGDFELDMTDLYNSTEKMETLAGAHLASKKAMAQALPLMISVLENPHLVEQLNNTGSVVDVKELFQMFLEVSEWKNAKDLIRPMTPEEQQAMQAANPGLQKMQAAMAQIQGKHEVKSREIDQVAQNKLANDLFLTSGDEAANYVERGVSREAQRNSPYVAGQ